MLEYTTLHFIVLYSVSSFSARLGWCGGRRTPQRIHAPQQVLSFSPEQSSFRLTKTPGLRVVRRFLPVIYVAQFKTPG